MGVTVVTSGGNANIITRTSLKEGLIFVGNANNQAVGVEMSGDATISSSGVVTVTGGGGGGGDIDGDLNLSDTSEIQFEGVAHITGDGTGNVSIPNGGMYFGGDGATSNRPAILNENTSGSNPVFIPDSDSLNSGLSSQAGTPSASLVANGDVKVQAINGRGGILSNTTSASVGLQVVAEFIADTTATPADGLGITDRWWQDTSSNNRIIGQRAFTWDVVDDATRTSSYEVQIVNSGTLQDLITGDKTGVTIPNGDLSISNGVIYSDTYTVSTLPSASTAGGQIFVSDETGGAVMAFSDGTNWRRFTDRVIVS